MENRGIFANLSRIKEIARSKNLSINALETRAKVANGTIRKWETTIPQLDSFISVANVLGVDYEEIIERRK